MAWLGIFSFFFFTWLCKITQFIMSGSIYLSYLLCSRREKPFGLSLNPTQVLLLHKRPLLPLDHASTGQKTGVEVGSRGGVFDWEFEGREFKSHRAFSIWMAKWQWTECPSMYMQELHRSFLRLTLDLAKGFSGCKQLTSSNWNQTKSNSIQCFTSLQPTNQLIQKPIRLNNTSFCT